MKRVPLHQTTKPILTMSAWAYAMARRVPQRLRFHGRTPQDYRRWRRAFEIQYREMLGRFPEKVALKPRILGRRIFRNYVRERVIFSSEPCMSILAWVCIPLPRRRGQRFPAVVCCHGHGAAGGNGLVGLDAKKRRTPGYEKSLATRLVEAGYVTITPDWRGFGERTEPPESHPAPRDLCNVAHLVAESLGYRLLTLDIWDAMRCVDYLATRGEVDIERLGCVGCSFGGTMSTFLAATDERIRAACISGYLSSTATGFSRWNTCGSQTLPDLLQWGDRVEVAGLICPRPLLIQIGEYDSVFPSWDALREYRRLSGIYRAAGVADCLGLDRFDGCHEIHVEPILRWFNQWIGGVK